MRLEDIDLLRSEIEIGKAKLKEISVVLLLAFSQYHIPGKGWRVEKYECDECADNVDIISSMIVEHKFLIILAG